MAISDDIKTFLDANSITGGATGWSTAISYMPESPDKVVYFNLTGSNRAPEADFFYPTVHFVVRGSAEDPQATIAKADALLEALDDATLSSAYPYTFVEENIIDIGRDKNNRPMFSLNVKIMETR